MASAEPKKRVPQLTLADFRKRCPKCGTGAINQAIYPDGTFECLRCGHKRPPPGAN